MRLAYADPPYPGQAKRHYGKSGDPFEGDVAEVDHAELVAGLCEYDGWALSTSMPALRDVLQLAPASAVVAVWHVTNAEPAGARRFLHWYSWEPVIVSPARARKDVRNVLATPALTGFLGAEITGQKPPAFCEWLFGLLGAECDDALDDLFPGSGAVGRAWDTFTRTLRIPMPMGRRGRLPIARRDSCAQLADTTEGGRPRGFSAGDAVPDVPPLGMAAPNPRPEVDPKIRDG